MTDHPCKGMTRAQRRAFERIAINQTPRCKESTLDALLRAGVILRGDSKRHDAFGVYTIPNYSVPLPIHVQWCEWCFEQLEPALCVECGVDFADVPSGLCPGCEAYREHQR